METLTEEETKEKLFPQGEQQKELTKPISDEEFRKNCSFIIDNSGELTDSFKQIDEKLEAYTWQN